METETLTRADLGTLAETLKSQHARKVDAVVSARSLSIDADSGQLIVPGLSTEITMDGVTTHDAALDLGDVAVGDLASRYDVPVKYARRCRSDARSLFAANFNEWLGRDDRQAFLRTFSDPEGGTGFARAILSDRYRVIDHLDVLVAALDGAKSTGHDVVVDSVDLTERAMRVRLVAPEINVLAPDLMRGYRTPFQEGWHGEQGMIAHGFYAPGSEPVLFAGLELSNSETGGGAFVIRPRIVFKACRNGLVITRDALRSVHMGQKLDEGVVRWSEGTIQANADLVRSQTSDAVSSFLDVEYMRKIIAEVEAKAGREVERPAEAIETVATKLRYSEGERETLLAHFIRGGQSTAGGVMQAVTSMAQTIADPDRAAEVEATALDALALVG